ncbi:hypothetical protein ACFQY5_25885 [Paeniroseomonas aquatica]|uniref:DUF3995 domain-containing protein n=1 Tax=Paeniroseomonas aquatica TaxID=373043 RepID=A0ABT8AEZ2_9PROT|nr:hypothetical protein [Paeniroseomonas aquatica]MDN3568036.1 hypothetical protein [Paeniroseomonas aquatica]
MAHALWSAGAILVVLGLIAHLFGWEAVVWIPEAALDAIREDPKTYGIIALGLLLMFIARLITRRRP